MKQMVLLAVLVLFLAMFCLPLQAQQPPQWLQQINPADYALLAADLVEGLGFGEINAEAQAAELGITDAQGRTSVQQSFFFNLIQSINAQQGEEAGWVKIYVAVFANTAESKAFARQHFGNYGMNPDWMVNANDLGDRRIPANGGSVTGPGRAIIRYRNIVASFSWNGRIDEVGTQKTVQVAKLWLNKIAGPPGADLLVRPDYIIFKQWANDPQVEREAAADKQYVMGWVHNRSADVTAQNVEMSLSVKFADAQDYVPIGAPQRIASIAPGTVGKAVFEWDLRGENVVNADLLLSVKADGPPDVDPRNNETHQQVSIYYAHNGTNAYRWLEDSYQFVNYTYPEEDTVELVREMLATIISQMHTDPQAIELLNHLIFPQTYMRFFDYMKTSLTSGSGGHCYGMVATAGLYFEDRSLSPSGAATWNLTPEVADANIKLYHRAQMLPLARALMSGKNYFDTDWGGVKSINMIRQMLRARTPAKITIAGLHKTQEQVVVNGQPQQQPVEKMWAHAVLAYKLIEPAGSPSIVCVYDPNLPPMQRWNSQKPMSAFVIDPSTGGFSPDDAMKALYIKAANQPGGEMTLEWMAAGPVDREISLAEANAFMPEVRAKLKEMTDFLAKGRKLMASLMCPADVVFTDPQGRRTGQIGATQINEIPGAEVRTGGEVEIYILPADVPLTVSITGNGAGEATLDIIRPVNGDPALTSFQRMPVSAGSTLSGTLATGGEIAALSGDGATHAPTLTGTLSGDRVTWQQPGPGTTVTPPATPPTTVTPPVTPPSTTPTVPTSGGLVVCRSINNGQPVGAATSFDRIGEVWCLLNYANRPDGTAECVWTRDGQEVTRSQRQIGGTGWVAFSVSTTAPDGLKPGSYSVSITSGGATLGSAQFTVGAAPGVQPPATTVGGIPPSRPTIALTSGDSSRPAPGGRRNEGGFLELKLRWSGPGSILDTVGIAAANIGDFCLSVDADGRLIWQIYDPPTPGAHRNENGWHYLASESLLPPNQWHTVRATWGPVGMSIAVDGAIIAYDLVNLRLSGSDAFIGDFPGDNGWTAYQVHRSFIGEVGDLRFGN